MRKELPSPDGWTPVKVVGPGEQFGQRTLEAPKDDQNGRSELGHEKTGVSKSLFAAAWEQQQRLLSR